MRSCLEGSKEEKARGSFRSYRYVLVHLETHPVVDLVVSQRDVILERSVPGRVISERPAAFATSSDSPLLQLNLLCRGTRLCCDQTFEVPDGIRWQAFDADFAVYQALTARRHPPFRPSRSFAITSMSRPEDLSGTL